MTTTAAKPARKPAARVAGTTTVRSDQPAAGPQSPHSTRRGAKLSALAVRAVADFGAASAQIRATLAALPKLRKTLVADRADWPADILDGHLIEFKYLREDLEGLASLFDFFSPSIAAEFPAAAPVPAATVPADFDEARAALRARLDAVSERFRAFVKAAKRSRATDAGQDGTELLATALPLLDWGILMVTNNSGLSDIRSDMLKAAEAAEAALSAA